MKRRVLNKIKLGVMSVAAIMLIAGCGNVDVDVTTDNKQEIEHEQETEEEVDFVKEEVFEDVFSINVSGRILEYPITRKGFIDWIDECGWETENNDRFVISCSNPENKRIRIYARFLETDEDICTYLSIYGNDVSFDNIISPTDLDVQPVFDKISDSSSDYYLILDQGKNGLAFKKKGSEVCFHAKYNEALDSFNVYLNKDHYDNDGSVVYSLGDNLGYYLSSTDIAGLYRITPPDNIVMSPKYYAHKDIDLSLNKVKICNLYDSYYGPDINLIWNQTDNIWFGKDKNGEIIQIYEDGFSAEKIEKARLAYQEYCGTHNITIESDQILKEMISDVYDIELIQYLDSLISFCVDDYQGCTVQIRKDSIKKGLDEYGNATCTFKATIVEYPDAQIIGSCVETKDSFGAAIDVAHLIENRMVTISANSEAAYTIFGPDNISSEFDDFDSKSDDLLGDDYADLPVLDSLDAYTAYYFSSTSIPGIYLVVDEENNPIAKFYTDETELCDITYSEITLQKTAETYVDPRWTWVKSHGLGKAYDGESIVIVYSYSE